jgi:hypothetical protein
MKKVLLAVLMFFSMPILTVKAQGFDIKAPTFPADNSSGNAQQTQQNISAEQQRKKAEREKTLQSVQQQSQKETNTKSKTADRTYKGWDEYIKK